MMHHFDRDSPHLLFFHLPDDKFTDLPFLFLCQFHHHTVSALAHRIDNLLYLKGLFAAVLFYDMYLICRFVLFVVISFHSHLAPYILDT